MTVKKYSNYIVLSSANYDIVLVRIDSCTYRVTYCHAEGGKLDEEVIFGSPRNIWRTLYHEIRAAERSAIPTKLR